MVWLGVHGRYWGPMPALGFAAPPAPPAPPGPAPPAPDPPPPAQAWAPAGAPAANQESRVPSSVVVRGGWPAGGIGEVALWTRICIICHTASDGFEGAAACVSA